MTTITIVPRDADGNMLGRGLAVAIDASLLWPLKLSGPVQDLGDGSYRAGRDVHGRRDGKRSSSTSEGVVLASSPVVEATPLAGSLRDLAILQLRDLTRRRRPPRRARDASGAELGPGGPASARRLSRRRDDNALKTDLDSRVHELQALERRRRRS
jgi:hypothetical protein